MEEMKMSDKKSYRVIAPVKIIDNTNRAYFIRWFDRDVNDHVCAWIPKRFVRISGMTMYIETYLFNQLELKRFRFRR